MFVLLWFEGIIKWFGVLIVNGDVLLDLRCGEILVFFGENGVGKMILMNIFFGYYVVDEGWVLVSFGIDLFSEFEFGLLYVVLVVGIGMVY